MIEIVYGKRKIVEKYMGIAVWEGDSYQCHITFC